MHGAYSIDSANEKVVFCINDSDGFDTLDLSGYSQDQIINLTPGEFSNAGGLTKKDVELAAQIDQLLN